MEHTPKASPTFRIETLGCKSNQYDSQRLAEALGALGYQEAGPDAGPDLIVVNTCTVTQTADRKARQLIRRALRSHPQARVFVTGCYATLFAQEVRRIPGVKGVYGRDRWPDLLEAVAGAGVRLAEGDFGIAAFRGRTRAFLKVQEGCDAFCSYCIVPHARGRPRSRPPADACEEARRLIEAGFREIVLTGIHLGIYGRDLPDAGDLADVVRALAALPGIERLRLSSLEPLEVTDRLLDAMAGSPVVCAHLHLPLQSGDDGVLARMQRPYTARRFLEVLERVRAQLDEPAVSTDVMVGFPGETDEAFGATADVCVRAGFSRLHAFPYSPRPGTPAAQMGDRPAAPVVRGRMKRLTDLAGKLAGAWAERFVGRTVRVLFEEKDARGRLAGYTERYVRVSAEAPERLIGRSAPVRCTRARGAQIEGEVCGGEPTI